MRNDERRPPAGDGAQTAGEVVTTTVADHDRARALLTRLRASSGLARPGCPCGCASIPGDLDDPACARHRPVTVLIDYSETGQWTGSRYVRLADLEHAGVAS